MNRNVRIAAALTVVGLVSGCSGIGLITNDLFNTVSKGKPATNEVLASCGPKCAEMADLFIADLHADPFLWGRDIRKLEDYGHVDIPRLRKAGVDLQVFSVPSSTPWGLRPFTKAKRPEDAKIQHPVDDRFIDPEERYADYGGLKCTRPGINLDTSKTLSLLTRGETDTRRIAFWQAKAFCEASGGTPVMDDEDGRLFRHCHYQKKPELREPDQDGGDNLFPIFTRQDLEALRNFNAARSIDKRAVGGLLSIEGVHWIWDSSVVKPEIKALKDAGFRMIGLTHKFTNRLAGSDEDCRKPPGLTPLGVEVVREVLDQGLILDVAHLSADSLLRGSQKPKSVMEILQEAPYRSRKPLPVVMSHGGVRLPYCENPRNLPDQHVDALMEAEVPFGIIQWDQAYCVSRRPRETVVRRILDAYAHSVKLAGWDTATNALALGADLDGAVRAPFDVTGFPYLLSRIAASDWCEAKGREACRTAIARIAGENVYDVLIASLPEWPTE